MAVTLEVCCWLVCFNYRRIRWINSKVVASKRLVIIPIKINKEPPIALIGNSMKNKNSYPGASLACERRLGTRLQTERPRIQNPYWLQSTTITKPGWRAQDLRQKFPSAARRRPESEESTNDNRSDPDANKAWLYWDLTVRQRANHSRIVKSVSNN